jgi:uncharacterized protein YcbK (DUF882 family)
MTAANDVFERFDAGMLVHVGNARLKTCRFSVARAGYSCALALLCFLFGSKVLQNAIAEGDTRTITMHHLHTGEDITITYKRDGRYDEAALEKLNWFLRDWRKSEATHMDPRLIDLVWEVQREATPNQPIQVVCGYRSPETNAMLRHRSGGVARFSQHMLGRAMDFFIPAVPLEKLREIGLRLQRGGVGFYPESGSPFVHMDVGGIRMWPRMTHEELARVFPDGRTVHIPTDGKPLPGYALALADITKRGSTPSQNSLEAARTAGVHIDTLLASNERPAANPFAKLLGLAKDEDDEDDTASTASPRAAAPAVAAAATPSKHPVLAAIERGAETAGKATVKVAIKVADAASKAKLIRTASAATAPQAPAQPSVVASAATTPNQIIVARGYWQGPADPSATANSLASAQRQRRTPSAAPSAVADATGSIGPFANPHVDGAAPQLALAYADPPARDAVGIAALRAAAISAQQTVANGTTIAVKRAANQVASAITTAGTASLTVIKAADAHFANPWLRAVVLSPSVQHFLTITALGARDFRSLATLMVKPSSSVLMTFSADPNPGLDNDRFSGSAIVFVSTVSYPTRTASLQ